MKLTPRTKILVTVLLLVVAVGAWYALYSAGTQIPAATPAPEPPKRVAKAVEKPTPAKATVATSTSARVLEVLPLPFLVTEAPAEATAPPPATPEAVAEAQKEKTLPNPFAPLKAELAQKKATKPAPIPIQKTPVSVSLPPRVPTPRVVRVQQGTPDVALPSLTQEGALPLRLGPIDREVRPRSPKAAEPRPKPALSLPESRLDRLPPAPGETGGSEPSATPLAMPIVSQSAPAPAPSKANPLLEWAQNAGLKLSGVALGPVSVAIFKTSTGYLTLSVGQSFPGTDIILKSVTAERVLLTQGPYTLTLEYGGGE